ncbi:MAG: 4Fe-4S binding protein [Bacteroidota bacterium]|nr:4Fe-4S binding protein [Bacteroidota bacterium]
MCEFCTQHGEGKKWYLNAKNYSAELLNDLSRIKFIEEFYHEVIHKGNKTISIFEKKLLKQLGIGIPNSYKQKMVADYKESHYGQVVPLEDIEKILSMCNSIVRVSCGCRWAKEKKESRLCYGISFSPTAWYSYIDLGFFGSPHVSSFEQMTKEEALVHITESDRKGYVHSVWTFKTPFIGAICNCDLNYCLAMRSTVGLDMPTMFKAEYVASLETDKCNGCQACIEQCQFSAIDYNETTKSCTLDRYKCFGCGVCRASCSENAISLQERILDPVTSTLW